LTKWSEQKGIEICWIRPGKPTENAYIERFNATLRPDVLDAYLLGSLRQVREVGQKWVIEYNTQRPHQALGFLTPLELKQAG
jgi:putative transposase